MTNDAPKSDAEILKLLSDWETYPESEQVAFINGFKESESLSSQTITDLRAGVERLTKEKAELAGKIKALTVYATHILLENGKSTRCELVYMKSDLDSILKGESK